MADFIEQPDHALNLEELSAAIPGRESVRQERAIAVALSGGPDSMALCRLLADWCAREEGPALHALIVDHGLRPESADEARQVGRWVQSWPGVHHEVLTRLPPSGNNSRIQEKARHDRYRLMADYCRERGIIYLFLGHHQDDQAETVLFRLAKGSGLDGLAGMKPLQSFGDDLLFVRPLLFFPKARLLQTCIDRNVPFLTDPSNSNDRFARARLRHSRAILEQEGLTAKRLSATAHRICRARAALDFYTEKVWQETLIEKTDMHTVLNLALLREAPAEIRLRCLQRLYVPSEEGQEYGPRLERLENLIGRIFDDPGFRGATLGGLRFRRDKKKGHLVIEKEKTVP